MGQTHTSSTENAIAGTAAKHIIDSFINEVGHTFVNEIVQDVARDIVDEFSPKALFGDFIADMSNELDELKPNKIFKAVVLGK